MEKVLLPVAPFTPTYIALFLIQLLIAVIIGKKIRPLPDEKKRKIIFYIYLGVFIFFCAYKLLLPLDKSYMDLYPKLYGEFSYLNEIPFNACNISIWMTCIAMKTNNKGLKGFCFFISCLGPLFALLLPIEGFQGESLLTIHVFGYYVSHFAALMIPVILILSRVYVPTFKAIPSAVLTTLVVDVCVFVLDTILRVTNLNPVANFMFCYYHDDNPILKLFYNWLNGIPLIYTLPCVIIMMVSCYLITAICTLLLKRSEKKNN